MKEVITKLNADLALAEEKVKNTRAAIKAVQQVCDHQFEYVAHSHNDEIYDCTVCGLTEYR